jgi:hypothetical protein
MCQQNHHKRVKGRSVGGGRRKTGEKGGKGGKKDRKRRRPGKEGIEDKKTFRERGGGFARGN